MVAYANLMNVFNSENLQQFMQVSFLFPFSTLFLIQKCFTLVNTEWRNGVFQGIVTQIVGKRYVNHKFFFLIHLCLQSTMTSFTHGQQHNVSR